MAAISIIVPVYKVEKYIHRCIDSILDQTMKDFELILVDDGSPDRCGQICDEYAQKDKRIRVIHQANAGLSAARNAGLDIAAGEYISFVDSDDYIDKDMEQKLYDCMQKHHADIGMCQIARVDEKGDRIASDSIDLSDGLIDKTYALKMIDCLPFIPIWNKLYKKHIFTHIRFPIGKICEDMFILPQIYYACSNIAFISDELCYYTKRAESISGKPMTIERFDSIEARYRRILFYEQMGLLELADETAYSCMNRFCDYRKELIAKTKADRKRLREVKRMVRYCVRKHGKAIRKKEILSFEMPRLVQFLWKVKQTLLRDHASGK